jgi:hypothetical protein
VVVSPTILFKRCLGVAGGLSLYLTLPVRASFDPPLNWGDASTFKGFLWLVSGEPYLQYPFSLPLVDVYQRLRGFLGFLLDQYTWIGVFLGIYGLISLPPRRILFPSLWMGGVFLLFAIFYGSIDSQVYLLSVWLAFAIWLANGLSDLLMLIINHPKIQIIIVVFLLAAIMLRIPFLYSSIDASRDFRAQDFINNSFRVIPLDSLVFVDGDEQIFSLWYAQFALGQRPDMIIVAEGLLSYRWYLENLQHTYKNLHVSQKDKLRASVLAVENPDRTICFISHEKQIACIPPR